MCIKEDCESGEIAIQDYSVDVVSLLHEFELCRYTYRGQTHPEISYEIENKLVEACYALRRYCWSCARPHIERLMIWNFSFLDLGFPLSEHAELMQHLDGYHPISQEWKMFLVALSRPTHYSSEFVDFLSPDVVRYFSGEGISPYSVKKVFNWYFWVFDEVVESEVLKNILKAGYEEPDELRLLQVDEYLWDRLNSVRVVPSCGVLDRVDMSTYMKLETFSYAWCNDGLSEEEIIRILDLGISPDVLVSAISELNDDFVEQLEEDLDENYCNLRGVSFTECFLETLAGLVETGLEIAPGNLTKFWSLTAEQMLYVIDHDIKDKNFIRLARVLKTNPEIDEGARIMNLGCSLTLAFLSVKSGLKSEIISVLTGNGLSLPDLETSIKYFSELSSEEIMNWLSVVPMFASVQVVKEWKDSGFSPVETAAWAKSGFDPISAGKWMTVTTDPLVAKRRRDAGINVS